MDWKKILYSKATTIALIVAGMLSLAALVYLGYVSRQLDETGVKLMAALACAFIFGASVIKYSRTHSKFETIRTAVTYMMFLIIVLILL